jgi:hypothetical protein
MKSKTLRKRTRRRRGRRDVKKTKTKRGGMFRQGMSAARSKMGTTLYHEFLPLFTTFNNHIIGQKLTPDQNAVVLNGNLYFETVFDIPADDAVRASITKLKKEWSSTEQTAEKALGFYNKLLLTLKNAEIRRKQKQGLKTQITYNETFSSPLSESLASIVPMSLRNDNYSLTTPGKPSNTDIPQKVSGDEKGSQSVLTPSTGRSFAPTLHNPLGDKTVQHLSFDDELRLDTTPPTSPANVTSPPRLLSKSRGHFSPLSPSKPPPVSPRIG